MTVTAEELVLAVNSGSSSLKLGLFALRNGEEVAVLSGGADGIGTPQGHLLVEDDSGKKLLDESYTFNSQTHALEESIGALLRFSHAPMAVGHRVVHGGPHLRQHTRITGEVVQALEAAVHFAPLHIPSALALIRATEQLFPNVPQFACFDTAFHATMPLTSATYAVPETIRAQGVQRYGFHGLSYESIVYRLRDNMPQRMVCAHLGSGASVAALRDGRSIDTSMGLTPTGGLPMATRTGDLDPGVLIFLLRSGVKPDDLEPLVNRNSGLAAIAGDSDMRTLQDRMAKGDKEAVLAIDIFAGAVRKFVGAYAAELGGLDLLVFSGGIGEHSAVVREKICKDLGFLGIRPQSGGCFEKVEVMESEEEAQIARHCRRLLRS